MNEPLGYNLFNANDRTWFTSQGDWKPSYFDARCFDTLEGANREMEKLDSPSNTGVFFVFACMPIP